MLPPAASPMVLSTLRLDLSPPIPSVPAPLQRGDRAPRPGRRCEGAVNSTQNRCWADLTMEGCACVPSLFEQKVCHCPIPRGIASEQVPVVVIAGEDDEALLVGKHHSRIVDCRHTGDAR